jgi:hypothetical protein
MGTMGPIGLTGANGADGVVGTMGPIGLTGANGADGVVGPIGLTGADGVVGTMGPIGLTGADGVVGTMGPIGLTGADGVVGPIGLTGADGVVGTMGPIGLTGADGVVGPIGLTGADGVVGTMGPIGLTGADGVVGPIGLTGADGVVGTMGPIGLTGTQGSFVNLYVSNSITTGSLTIGTVEGISASISDSGLIKCNNITPGAFSPILSRETQVTSITTDINSGNYSQFGSILTVSSSLPTQGSTVFSVYNGFITANTRVISNIVNYNGTGLPSVYVSNATLGIFTVTLQNNSISDPLNGTVEIGFIALG